ncbi:MAG: SynChlorMet cassette protein ScmC [Anaerolineales bacterium]
MTKITSILTLTDGTKWRIKPRDSRALELISRLNEVMHLHPADNGSDSTHPDSYRYLHVSVLDSEQISNARQPRKLNNIGYTLAENSPDGHAEPQIPVWTILQEVDEHTTHCALGPLEDGASPYVQLSWLSLVIARHASTRGGLLLHGALAEREGVGIILAGPGGEGKTMASNRLPPPWRSLSDDQTLIVRDAQGTYRAHPWPTWSRFMNGDSGGAWDVQHSVQLRGIYFLSQEEMDQANLVGEGEALCMLLESVAQASNLMCRDLSLPEKQALHMQRFDNACQLVKAVPAYELFISKNGDFWREIDQALSSDEGNDS